MYNRDWKKVEWYIDNQDLGFSVQYLFNFFVWGILFTIADQSLN